MTAELVFAITALIGGLSGVATIIWSRRKLTAEGLAKEAEAVERYNKVILKQLDYLDAQVAEMRRQQGELEKKITEYRKQIEETLSTNLELRKKIEKLEAHIQELDKRIAQLEEFIRAQGDIVPPPKPLRG